MRRAFLLSLNIINMRNSTINLNKTYHCTDAGISSVYVDTNKQYFIPYATKSVQKEKPVQKKYTPEYTAAQNRMYKQCLYGLKLFTQQELSQLSTYQKAEIKTRFDKTQTLINLSKHLNTAKLVKSVITRTWNKLGDNISWFINYATELELEDNCLINPLPLSLIGGKNVLVEELIARKILPEDFHNLK